MKMERGPSYAEYEDGTPLNMVPGTCPSSSEDPVKRVNMPSSTGRIMDRKDALFQRSKGQWKYVANAQYFLEQTLTF
jgi:hypothetical protein